MRCYQSYWKTQKHQLKAATNVHDLLNALLKRI